MLNRKRLFWWFGFVLVVALVRHSTTLVNVRDIRSPVALLHLKNTHPKRQKKLKPDIEDSYHRIQRYPKRRIGIERIAKRRGTTSQRRYAIYDPSFPSKGKKK